jgi:hypothetical protein
MNRLLLVQAKLGHVISASTRALCRPIAQAPCVVGSIGQQLAGKRGRRQVCSGAGEVVGIAGRD